MSADDYEIDRKAILKQREIDEIKRLGLPYLRVAMSHNAAAVELRRSRKRMEVRARLLKASEEERRQPPEPEDPAEGVARALLRALESGGEQRQRAEEFLKTAHPRIKEKMLELEGAASQWKKRRSNQRNGY